MAKLLLIFLGAAASSFLFSRLAVNLRRTNTMIDLPGRRKIHSSPTPRSGGPAALRSVFSAASLSPSSPSATC